MIVSRKQAYRQLLHALAVEPGAEARCPVCGDQYVPEDAMCFCCSSCFLRLRRVADFKTTALLVALKQIALRGATATAERAT